MGRAGRIISLEEMRRKLAAASLRAENMNVIRSTIRLSLSQLVACNQASGMAADCFRVLSAIAAMQFATESEASRYREVIGMLERESHNLNVLILDGEKMPL